MRLSAVQRTLLHDLAAILGTPDVFQSLLGETLLPAPAVSPLDLRGYVIAIYTLSEGVGQRVATQLQRSFPGVRVEILNDLVSSPRLQELSRRADLFLIAWLSAKHAATEAIRRHRPDHLPILYAPGKGSSSMINDITAHLESIQQTEMA